MMHTLLIHQAFVSPKESGGTRHYELARHAVKQGQAFTIVASDLSYLTGQPTIARAGGLFKEEELEGVRVLRAYTYPSLHRSFAWRVVSFLSFMFTSVWAGLRAGPVDLVMGTSPPIFQGVSAWLVATLRRRPFLLEIRDLWPEFAIELGVLKNPLLIKLSLWLERFLYSQAVHLIVNSPAYRDYLIDKGIPEAKITLIPNGVDTHMFDPKASGERIRKDLGLNGHFIVTYAGALGLANDIQTILRAAERLREQSNIHFLLVGDGKERAQLQEMARQLELPNVTFTGICPKSEIAEILAASDACIACLKDIPMFRTTYPNKVFDYMAAGRPTILAIDGVIRKVIEAAGGGLFVPPGNDTALAQAVHDLSRDRQKARAVGTAARTYVVKHFDRHEQAVQFMSCVEKFGTKGQIDVRGNLYRNIWKRLFDLALTILALVLSSPVLGIIALLVRMDSPGPVLFIQERLGKQGRVFRAYKFRTMTDRPRASHREIMKQNSEVTRVGYWLRRFKLDELPQVLNIIKGDMSIVGPRPALTTQRLEYDEIGRKRMQVRPGLTGLAQINGNIHLSWPERWRYDAKYVDQLSFRLDLKIILRTVIVVILGEDQFLKQTSDSE